MRAHARAETRRRRMRLAAKASPRSLLLTAALALAGFWFFHGVAATAAFAVGVGATGGLLLARTDAKDAEKAKRRGAALVALGAVLLYGGLERWAPGAPLPYDLRLRAEIATAFLPFAWAVAARRAAGLRGGHGFRAFAAFAFLAGTGLRITEVLLLMQTPGTEGTIRYSLRVDAAYALWAVAAVALAVAAVLAAANPARRRRLTVAALVVVLLAVPAVDLGAALGVTASGPHELRVGVHADDLASFPRDVFDFAHLDIAWETVEPREGARDWTLYDEQLRLAEARGIPVYLLVSTYPPRWLTDAYPEAVMTDADGNPFHWIDEAPGTPLERVWDVSFHHEAANAAKLDFLRAAIERYAPSPAVDVVAVLNEPAYPSDWNLLRWASHDAATVGAFVSELGAESRGSLDVLNARYGTEYESWDEVQPPRRPIDPLADRWQEFREDSLVEHVHRFIAEARLVTDKPVTVKIAAHYLSRFALPQAGLTDRVLRAVASMSDVVSVDLYPVSAADLARSLEYFHHLADGKPLIVSEFNLVLGGRAPLSGAQLLASLGVLDRYADAVVLFTLDDHYLYRMGADGTAFPALMLFRAAPGSIAFPQALATLIGAEIRAITREAWAAAVHLPQAGDAVLGAAAAAAGTSR